MPTINELSIISNRVTKNFGYYFEIGNTVFVTFSVITTTTLNTNDGFLSGLPLPINNAFRFESIERVSSTSVIPLITHVNSVNGFLCVASQVSSGVQITGSCFYKKVSNN